MTDPTVTTREKYKQFISTVFPLFTRADQSLLDHVYDIKASAPGDNGTRFDTLGDRGPTALTQSDMATGIQQTVFNIAAESTFDCPVQWLAEAYDKDGRQAWKYQYSVTPSYHAADLGAYFVTNETTFPDAGFRHAFQKIWGNFIINDSPIISLHDATAGYTNATVPTEDGENLHWPEFTLDEPWQMDLNTTGGKTTLAVITDELSYQVRTGPGIVNKFRLVDALSWEGGRGDRCSFWQDVSERVPN